MKERLTRLRMLTPLAYSGGKMPLFVMRYPIAIHIIILSVGANAKRLAKSSPLLDDSDPPL